MRVLLTALTCEKRAIDANLAMHLDVLADAAASDCRLVVFPEFSLTGSVDPANDPDGAVAIDHPAVRELIAATGEHQIASVFGLSERSDDRYFITQVVACDGQVLGAQRKRHLGEDEAGYAIGTEPCVVDIDGERIGIIICAEAGVDWTWDDTVGAGATIVLFCSAPGLYDRGASDASWRSSFEWWERSGLGDAIRHGQRLGVHVAMSTQAGTTIDENFPGLAALIDPDGTVVDRLPDWLPGTLIVTVPSDTRP